MTEPLETTPTEASVSGKPVSAQLRGEGVAYALQNVGQQVVGLTWEPYLNTRIQKKFAPPDRRGHISGIGHSEMRVEDRGRYGHFGQNFLGEFAGDVIGASALIGAELVVPNQFHAFTRKARAALDPAYDMLGRRLLKGESGNPAYEKKLKDWKLYQERNMVRTLVIAPVSLTSNVLLQKSRAINNPSPWKTILFGKMATTAFTSGVFLIGRIIFPEHTRRFDEFLSNKLVAPVIENGIDGYENGHKPDKAKPHVAKLLKERKETVPTPAR